MRRGNLLQIESSSQICETKKVCETIRPVDSEVSKMHEAEVHVFSDSVLRLGKSAMNEPEIKLTKRWIEYLVHCKESARRFDAEQTQFNFHKFPGSKTNEIG